MIKVRLIKENTEQPKQPVSYTAIVLYSEDADSLKSYVPENWEAVCHHCTIHMGAAKDPNERSLLGKEFTLNVFGIVKDNMVSAIKVQAPPEIMKFYSGKGVTHITVGVNRSAGAKPVISNNLDWAEVQPIDVTRLRGKFIEVSQGNNSFALHENKDY